MTELTDILDDFELIGDWDDRYQYLIELGEQLPAMPATLKTEDNRVKPCMSTVHVHGTADAEGRISYQGDCDTAIIKGVLALLIRLFSGKTLAEIRDINIDELFDKLKLAEHLSPNRHVGIYAIVEVMKSQATACSMAPVA
jgi:cysteine desulfuration protein SufE